VFGPYGQAGMSRLSSARTRSVSAENVSGGKGAGGAAMAGTGAEAARELGRVWKVSPSIEIAAGATATLAEVRGPGVIRRLWLTAHPDHWRSMALRFFWDDATSPAVAVPLGDFFCQGWAEYAHVNSLPVAVNPYAGCNSYWEMPFRTRARLEIENLGPAAAVLYYQVDYEEVEVPDDAAYLHAAWQRSNPLADREVHTLLDGATGPGHYFGTYLAWGSNSSGWWGKGR
jgi:Protein of unknown function (DUF2961)